MSGEDLFTYETKPTLKELEKCLSTVLSCFDDISDQLSKMQMYNETVITTDFMTKRSFKNSLLSYHMV